MIIPGMLPEAGHPLVFPRRPKYGDDEVAAVTRLLRGGRLSEVGRGSSAAAIEDAFAALTGTTRALSFNSGTASLHAAVFATGADVTAGVVVSPMTWGSAIMATFQAGSYPVFADLDPDTPNLSPQAAADVAGGCASVMVTHTYGIPARLDELVGVAKKPLIEDCSHAHGAAYRGRPVGSWGAAGCFSLQDSKSVSGGEGGILTTSDERIYRLAMSLGHHPVRLASEFPAGEVMGAMYKFRIPALAAVVALEQVRSLPGRMAASEANLAVFEERIRSADAPVRVCPVEPGTTRGWYGSPMLVDHGLRVTPDFISACQARGVALRALYDDWLIKPLLQDREALAAYFPHVSATPFVPPRPEQFPVYYDIRSRIIILKIPDIEAADYMAAAADVIASQARLLVAKA